MRKGERTFSSSFLYFPPFAGLEYLLSSNYCQLKGQLPSEELLSNFILIFRKLLNSVASHFAIILSPPFAPDLCSCVLITCECIVAHLSVYKSCRNSRHQRTLLFQRLNKDNRYNPISPWQCCCGKFQERFLQLPGELELLVPDAGVGLRKSLLNSSCHKLLLSSPKLTGSWVSTKGVSTQESQASFPCVTSHKYRMTLRTGRTFLGLWQSRYLQSVVRECMGTLFLASQKERVAEISISPFLFPSPFNIAIMFY